MQLRDVMGLALAGLWQRRLRAVLTTLGVAVGCFVLVTSLSIGQGVQGVIFRQLRKQDQLRRLIVWPGGGARAEDIPPSALELPGTMSAERRQRLREATIQRWERPARRAGQGLSEAQIEALRKLPHVEAVIPHLMWIGQASLAGKRQTGQVRVAAPDDAGLTRRMVAGRTFEPGDTNGVLISEYLAYRLGARDEDQAAGMVGKTLRLEVSQPQPGISSLLFLLNLKPDMTPEERRVLGKVLLLLPAALEKLDLPDAEKKLLFGMLRKTASDRRKIREELPILGVFRDVTRRELSPFDATPRPVDMDVPGEVARRMYFAVPGRTRMPQVVVRVDSEDHLQEVHDAIVKQRLEVFSLAELVRQVRLNVLLIAIACTFVALVALAVAAIGITNTMLMSVLERTHEIGVMKSVGARDGDVQAMFLAEGALVGLLGGLLGLLASWLVSFPGDGVARYLIRTQSHMLLEESVFVFPAWLVLGVPALVCGITTLASFYPARRAARIDPIAALRQR